MDEAAIEVGEILEQTDPVRHVANSGGLQACGAETRRVVLRRLALYCIVLCVCTAIAQCETSRIMAPNRVASSNFGLPSRERS